MIDYPNDDTYFRHNILLTDRQASRLPKAFANNSSAIATLSKAELSKIVQLGEFLGRIIEPLPYT